MTEQTLWQGWLPASALPATRDRVAKIARRATQKGFPPPDVRILGTEMRADNDRSTGRPTSPPTYHEWSEVSITAFGPLHLGGWILVGVVDELPNGEPFLRRVPGTAVTLPRNVMDSPKRCDHCHTVRERLETFLLHRDDEWRLVGRQCLRDFLGHDPAALIAYANELAFITPGGDGWDGNWLPEMWKFSDVLALAARVVDAYGYTSRAKSEETGRPSTRNYVSGGLGGDRSFADTFPVTRGSTALNEATVTALDALAWRERWQLSEWEQSLLDLWAAEYVTARQIGYVTSATILGLRALRTATKARDPQISRPLGEAGQRLHDLATVVTFVRHFDGDWGTRTLLKLRAGESDLLWWSSRYLALEPGEDLTLSATIKGYETDKYTGQPVTVLTNGRLVA